MKLLGALREIQCRCQRDFQLLQIINFFWNRI